MDCAFCLGFRGSSESAELAHMMDAAASVKDLIDSEPADFRY